MIFRLAGANDEDFRWVQSSPTPANAAFGRQADCNRAKAFSTRPQACCPAFFFLLASGSHSQTMTARSIILATQLGQFPLEFSLGELYITNLAHH